MFLIWPFKPTPFKLTFGVQLLLVLSYTRRDLYSSFRLRARVESTAIRYVTNTHTRTVIIS